MKTFTQPALRYIAATLLFISIFAFSAYGQNSLPADTIAMLNRHNEVAGKKRSFKMTTLAFGGNGALFTMVNGKPAVMTGGRGSATFNNRYTIGGGGWGMTREVGVESGTEGIYNYIKMGYGGIDLGYLILPGEKFNLGTKLLIAGGAVFKETVPESDDKSFKMFPLLEPTLYSQIALGKLLKLEMGVSYRYIRATNLQYVSARELSGFSCYIGFLISTGNSN